MAGDRESVDAIKEIKARIREEPDDHRIWLTLARALEEKGRIAEAGAWRWMAARKKQPQEKQGQFAWALRYRGRSSAIDQRHVIPGDLWKECGEVIYPSEARAVEALADAAAKQARRTLDKTATTQMLKKIARGKLWG